MQFRPEQNTGYRAIIVRIERTSPTDCALMVSRSMTCSSISITPSALLALLLTLLSSSLLPVVRDFSAALFGAFKGDTAALDQHPAGDNVVDHQQHKPDGDRGFRAAEQCL